MNEEKWSNKSCNLAKELKAKLAQKIDSVTLRGIQRLRLNRQRGNISSLR